MAPVSRATATVKFEEGVHRDRAWSSLAAMFRRGERPLAGLGPLRDLRDNCDNTPLSEGDAFSCATHAGKYELEITACRPPELIAYDVFNDRHNFQLAIERTELRIRGSDSHPQLMVSCELRFHGPGILRLFRTGAAERNLRGFLGEETRSTSWAGSWLDVPLLRMSLEISRA